MITYIKYPVIRETAEVAKIPMFVVCNKIANEGTFIVVYPENNKIGFYCKSLNKSDILIFKGRFNVEKCEDKYRILLAREWYKKTNQNMPRKIKKKLISTKEKYKAYLKEFNKNKLCTHIV